MYDLLISNPIQVYQWLNNYMESKIGIYKFMVSWI